MYSGIAYLLARTLSDVWKPTVANVPLSYEFADASAALLWGSNPGATLCGSNATLRLLIQAVTSILELENEASTVRVVSCRCFHRSLVSAVVQ